MIESVKPPITLEQLHRARTAILELAAQHGATNVRVFGSVARGEARPDSDVDFLVDFPARTSLWDVIGLWQDLSALLGCDVSVVTEAALDGTFRQTILRDAILL